MGADFMERIQDAKILLVDDNAELLELLLKILAGEGYNRLFPEKTAGRQGSFLRMNNRIL